MSMLKRYWAVQPRVKKHDQSGTLNWVQPINQDVGLTDYIILCLKRFSPTSEGVLSLFGTQIAAVFFVSAFYPRWHGPISPGNMVPKSFEL